MDVMLRSGRGVVGRTPVEPPLSKLGPQRANDVVVLLGLDAFGEEDGARSFDFLVDEVHDLHRLFAGRCLSYAHIKLDDVWPDYLEHGHCPDVCADLVQGQARCGRPLEVYAFKQSAWIVVEGSFGDLEDDAEPVERLPDDRRQIGRADRV